MKRMLHLFFLLSFFGYLSAAVNLLPIKRIDIEGLHRISRQTVLNAVPFKIGSVLTNTQSDHAIQSLYKTGFFSNVSIHQDKQTVVIKVVELPIITSIDIQGSDEIKKEDIEKMLRQIGMTVGQSLQPNQLHTVKIALEKNYASLGIYGARIAVTTKTVAPSQVKVKIDIHEGEIASVKGIRIVGNEHFSQKELTHDFQTATSHIWSPLFHDDRYSNFKLQADLESLRSFYYNHGYLDFQVLSTNTVMSDDGEAVYITIHIKEGPVYRLSQVHLRGNLLQYAKQLKAMVHVKAGEVFSRAKITASTGRITRFLSNHGYAFADVKVQPHLDRAKHQVALNLTVIPGHLIYIHAINFTGNNVTSDEVLRREMRQYEGAIFSYETIDESKRRIKNLGYIKKIDMTTQRVPGQPNQVDLNFTVEEKITASINFSLGYSTAYGFLYGVTWKQSNVLGSGKDFNIALERSKYNASASVDYTNPYFTSAGVSHNIGASFQKTTPGKVDLGDYRRDTASIYTGFSFPITEYQTAGFNLRLENETLHTNAQTPSEITTFTNRYGRGYKLMTLGLYWSYSHYNQAIFPTEGWQHYLGGSVSSNYTGNTLRYFKSSYSLGYYHPLTSALTFHARGNIRYGSGFGSTDKLPPFLNYYAGGLGSVAGYDGNALGPKNSNGGPLGGAASIDGGLSIWMPVGFSEDARAIVFVDGGNVFKNRIDFGDLRYSVGVGLSWNLGGFMPLQFAVAKAINPNGESQKLIDFSIGSSF